MEEEVITVENKGGKGNPNHVPAGDPEGKGGQFTSDDELGPIKLQEAEPEESKEDHMAEILKNLITKKRTVLDAEAKDIQAQFLLSDEDKSTFINLSREEKLTLLYNSPAEYDKAKIKFATTEQLNALLCAEACVNKKIQLEQDYNILEQQKEDLRKDLEKQLSQNNIEEFSGIWLGLAKHPSDYALLKSTGSFDKKIEYYNNVLANENEKLENKIKAKVYLKKLEQFEQLGQEYEKLKMDAMLGQADQVNDILEKQTALKKEISNFNDDSPIIQLAKDYESKFADKNAVYSKARKDAATWINDEWKKKHGMSNLTNAEAGIKYFGEKFKKMWNTMNSDEKYWMVDYTGGGYSKYNRPLRGLSHSGWHSWTSFATAVTNLTHAIDKCVWDEDIWVQRGIADSKMFMLPGSKKLRSLGEFSEDELQSLVGTSFTDGGFFSCGAGRGTGFSNSSVTFNVYCPKGTKMAYAGTEGQHKYENEMILQRGYSYRITKVEKKGYRYFLDVEVILGSDENKITDQEILKKTGKQYLI